MNHPRHHAPPRRAIAWALLAAALFGASTPLAKLWAAALPALQAAGLLYAGSGIGLGIWLLILGSGKTAPRWPDSAQWPWLLAAIGCGGVVAPVLLMLGETLDAVTARELGLIDVIAFLLRDSGRRLARLFAGSETTRRPRDVWGTNHGCRT